MERPLRLAMWSGPRNVSTALMRSFDARGDTVVCDEPLYAHYLAETGRAHPGRDEIVAREETDWRAVARRLTGPLPPGRSVFYQKHMAHHLLPSVGRGWLDALEHAFLIREPGPMVASLDRVLPSPQLEDTGLPQQVELFRHVADRTGRPPPVVDARDLLLDPAGVLGALCDAVGLAFDRAMLSWEPGLRDTDGCWAPHWYDAVARSTGFAPYRPFEGDVPGPLAPLRDACQPLHAELAAHRLGARSASGPPTLHPPDRP